MKTHSVVKSFTSELTTNPLSLILTSAFLLLKEHQHKIQCNVQCFTLKQNPEEY